MRVRSSRPPSRRAIGRLAVTLTVCTFGWACGSDGGSSSAGSGNSGRADASPSTGDGGGGASDGGADAPLSTGDGGGSHGGGGDGAGADAPLPTGDGGTGATDGGRGDSSSSGGDSGSPPPGPCTASCGSRVCGDDGCGGTCGACGFTQLCAASGACTTPATGGALLVDAASQLTRISSGVYGMGLANAESMKVATLDRWGGDNSSMYNWQVDVFNGSTWSQYWPPTNLKFQNHTADWLFDSPGRPSGTKCSDWFVKYNQSYAADTLMTVPAIGWVAKDSTSVGDPSGQNPAQNAVAADGNFMKQWVQHLVATFGDASHGGVKHYQLDNEPDNWKNSQADVHPNPASHTEIWPRTQTYASAIKAGDPTANVLILSTMNPADLVELNYIESGLTDPAFAGHPSSPQYSLAAWILQQAAAYEQQQGSRMVDCLDTHYPIETSSGVDPLQSTRSMWDPTFDTGFYFGQPQQLFPRMQQWINQNYPGTRICVSEYFTSNDGTGGATPDSRSGVIQAETLGLYGKYGLQLAAYWNSVTTGSGTHLPVYNAFAMYRNYDGTGGHFGDYSIGAVSPLQDVTVFASSDSPTAPTTLWVMVINKMTSTQNVTLNVANFTPAVRAHVYQSTPTTGPTALVDVGLTGAAVSLALPQYSITMVVVPKG